MTEENESGHQPDGLDGTPEYWGAAPGVGAAGPTRVRTRQGHTRRRVVTGVALAAAGVGGVIGATAMGGSSRSSAAAAVRPAGAAPGAAGAAPGAGGAAGVRGTIEAVTSSTLTVEQPSPPGSSGAGTAALRLTSATVVYAAAAGSTSDLKVGDHVSVVAGSTGAAAVDVTDSGSSGEAASVGAAGGGSPSGGTPGAAGASPPGGSSPAGGAASGRPAPGGGQPGTATAISGTVASAGSGNVTVLEASGSKLTFAVSSSTRVTVLTASNLSVLAKGDRVAVATAGSTSDPTASVVVVEPNGSGATPTGSAPAA